MTIERMKRVWLLGEAERLGELLDILGRSELVHLVDLVESTDGRSTNGCLTDGAPHQAPDISADLSRLDNRISKLQHTLDLLDSHVPHSPDFAGNFVVLPLEATPEEVSRAMTGFDADEFSEELSKLAEEYDKLLRRHESLTGELSELAPFAEFDVSAPPTLRTCVGRLGLIAGALLKRLHADERLAELISTNELLVPGSRAALVQVVALLEDADEIDEPLRRYGFAQIDMPEGISLAEHVGKLRSEADEVNERLTHVRKRFSELAETSRRNLVICLGHWEMTREVMLAYERTVSSKRITVISGYVRRRQVAELEKLLAEAMSSVGLVTCDPEPDEAVPVSLRSSRFFSPAQSLVDMFGVPDYFGFDPTPFVLFNFLVFFGCCFGDVIYGVVLIVAGILVARKYRLYPGKRDFFMLMAYGGAASIIVGMLTGSWASDLWRPEYLGENNLLFRIQSIFAVTDPLNKPMVALAVALGVGVINQFYGIIMSMYRDMRKRNYAGAAFDGGLWLLFLPGLLLAGAGAGLAMPGLSTFGFYMTMLGAAGLVLTQGRHEKSIIAKGAIGFISLYGIMGTYGTTGFVSDVLSYCRLLALGLTTMVVGLCFNLIAGMFRGIPGVGLGLFALFLVLGHTFNFLISILGAFVHSGRLIFVEFFGRFYDASGQRFRALGTSERVRIIEAQ